MSTNIGQFKGTKEVIGVKIVATGLPKYVDETVRLTRFSGDNDRGTCLQISIGNEHIQLDHATTWKLADLLQNWKSAPESE